MFLPRCFENIRPAILSESGGVASATKEQLDACGEELGREVCSVTKGVRTSEADTLFARRVDVDIPFGEPMDEAKLKQMAEDESEREIPVVDHTDVVVCGGGPAGVCAAISSARTGAGRVALGCPKEKTTRMYNPLLGV